MGNSAGSTLEDFNPKGGAILFKEGAWRPIANGIPAKKRELLFPHYSLFPALVKQDFYQKGC
jgi:hypothetical protein